MKKFFCMVLIFVFLFGNTIAQTSVGVSPEKLKIIKDYRLPAWGYKNNWINFNLSGYKRDQDRSIESNSGSFFSVLIRPSLYSYFESEKRIKLTEGAIFLDYSNYGYETHRSDIIGRYDSERENTNFKTDFILSHDNKKYHKPGNYWLFNINIGRNFSEEVDRSTGQNTSRSIERSYQVDLSFGVGIGRVREITPSIRALRLNERVQSLNRNMSLTDEEIRQFALHFTKYPGYVAIYDRPSKYFWKIFPEIAEDKFNNLSAFETFYLADVMDEAVGRRLEGEEANIGFRASRFERSFSETSSSMDITEGILLGIFTSARVYHNFSVKYQLGFESSFVLIQEMEDILSNKSEGKLSLEANQLWTITDRILWETKLNMIHRFRTYLKDGEEKKPRVNDYVLTNSFDYYIEDNLKIYFTLSLSLEKRKPEEVYITFHDSEYFPSSLPTNYGKQELQRVSMGLAYYFDSGLR